MGMGGCGGWGIGASSGVSVSVAGCENVGLLCLCGCVVCVWVCTLCYTHACA